MILASLIGAASGTAENLSVFDPASPPAADIRDLFYLVLAITAAIFVLVTALLIYCIVRFGRKGPADDAEPPQIYGSQPVEVAWTVAPLLVVFVLFLVVVRTVVAVRQEQPPEGALEVTVVGHQWWWEYRYPDPTAPDKEIVAVNEMHVPAGVPIYLKLESADVIHSFWVPRLAGKMDVVPGRVNRMWFQADTPAVYLGQCAEYCGTQHANMLLRVVVEPEEEYRDWLEGQKADAAREPSAEEGRATFLSLACIECHTVRGTPAVGKFGPDLTHLMSRQTLAARTLRNDHDNLTQWVRDPQVLKPGCNMPSFHLDDEKLKSVVQYLETLK